MARIPFFVMFCIEVNESAELADIILPDTHQLERLVLFPNRPTICMSPASNHYFWGVQQPVVPPAGEARNWRDVLIELADRVGFLPEMNTIMNATFGFKEPQRLDPSRRYSYEEIADRWAKSRFGDEHDLEWFRQHGYYSVPRTVQENYPATFADVRFPIYYEILKRQGERVKKVAGEIGFPVDTSDYQVFPDWKPCRSYLNHEPGFDFYAVNFKLPFHFQSFTSNNPWLCEMGENHPYAHKILMNGEAGRRRGLKDGDQIYVESEVDRVKGRVKLTEGIHPEVIAIPGVLGAWARGKTVGRGKGVHFNTLLPLTAEDVDWVSSGIDGCVKVKVYKAED